ncbi:MAG: hypothetical protein NC338_04795 [Firmicutes bacterium]|nr:hypothetical protein [Bacillota bacterium]MCM1401364.1 hypothetical protein [Bacteroides sp.]MCM1477389.1 hypothetical protein [Bacteroides sp.]
MKTFRALLASAALLCCTLTSHAQYYQLANQLTDVIRPALLGGFNYKGFVDASYTAGLGPRKASFVELTTTQGFQYASWFYMGVGLGVQALIADRNDNYNPWQYPGGWDSSRGHSKTGWVLPLYTDFRFNIGKPTDTSMFIDLRLGASFLLSDDYIEIGDGFLTNSEAFYFKPTIGMRVPLNESGKQAVNIGVSYQLLTQNYWYRYSDNVTLSSFGATIGFEW